MPDSTNWETVFLAAGVFLSAIGLMFNAWELRSSTKSRDVEALFKLAAEIREMEARLRADGSPAEKQARLVETLNFLNTCATACGRRLFPKWTHSEVSEYLVKAIANIESFEPLLTKVDAMRTDSTTFVELAKFSKANRARINRVRAEIQLLEAQDAETPA
ncbi:MAG: hypothetical protein EOR86_07570 [Mesorhizobium sp.]|uniref:hypothetical protein n=1 Tax=Mesorhizobium sp. TaxID=1871066 RepID=UPI000FE65170|nr:hypothetical protein [Mesorhizobium sp.]RWM97677.1 MAG: hypothetical protein EOR86_07570 [Mesorhizobium sp.]